MQSISVIDTLVINVNLKGIINVNETGFNPVTTINIKIFPNPAKDRIYIQTNDVNTSYKLKIVNTLSQVVYQTTINQTQYCIDLNTWSGTGTYFVQLFDSLDKLIGVRKLILQ